MKYRELQKYFYFKTIPCEALVFLMNTTNEFEPSKKIIERSQLFVSKFGVNDFLTLQKHFQTKNIYLLLDPLEKMGFLETFGAKQWKTYKITPVGERFVEFLKFWRKHCLTPKHLAKGFKLNKIDGVLQ